MKSTVRRPEFIRRSLAIAISRRMSATVEVTPERRMKAASVVEAINSAKLVLPTPGGPERMIALKLSASTARRRSLPGARMCFCPQYSSKVRGRIRAASGASAMRSLRPDCSVPIPKSNCSITTRLRIESDQSSSCFPSAPRGASRKHRQAMDRSFIQRQAPSPAVFLFCDGASAFVRTEEFTPAAAPPPVRSRPGRRVKLIFPLNRRRFRPSGHRRHPRFQAFLC
ncbi:hypothetical protein SDC9_152125 [bioreactor metagenome]|uniref:Uncharacterized protein n=1 Tax=bioreactor metagenome TaxID=1076179 RepID=A0A645ESR7_9ZZZZ